MKNIINKFSMIILVVITIITFTKCQQKTGKFELLLDSYIADNDIDKAKHYLVVNTNKWTDSTLIIVLEFAPNNKPILPKEVLKSSYKGIDIYIVGITPFPVSNGLYFETVTIPQYDPLQVTHDNYRCLQIIYYPKNDCFLEAINLGSNKEYFMNIFKNKGLLCK